MPIHDLTRRRPMRRTSDWQRHVSQPEYEHSRGVARIDVLQTSGARKHVMRADPKDVDTDTFAARARMA